MTIAYPHEPATLNPFARGGEAPATRDLSALVMPALYRIGPDGDRTPWLLAREPAVDPGPPFSVRLDLRPDAVWSDGRRVTAADLRFTWRAVVDSGSDVAGDGYSRIARVDVVSPSRARLVFRSPFARWADLFSSGTGVLPRHELRGRRAAVRSWRVSGGPFRLVRWVRGLEMRFERNSRAPVGVPLLDAVRVRFVPDATTALELLRRGRVDALAGYQAVDLARRAERLGAMVSSAVGGTLTGLVFDTTRPPVRDAAVRTALALSTDLPRIVRGLVGREGRAASAGRLVAAMRRAALRPADDPARARDLLERAGRRPSPGRQRGLRVSFSVAVVPDSLPAQVVRAVRVQVGRAGIELVPVPLDPDRLWESWLHGDRLRAAVVAWRGPPSGRVRELLTPRSLLMLYEPAVSVAHRPGIEGVRANAGPGGPLWNAHEWWVAPPARALSWYPSPSRAGVLE